MFIWHILSLIYTYNIYIHVCFSETSLLLLLEVLNFEHIRRLRKIAKNDY